MYYTVFTNIINYYCAFFQGKNHHPSCFWRWFILPQKVQRYVFLALLPPLAVTAWTATMLFPVWFHISLPCTLRLWFFLFILSHWKAVFILYLFGKNSFLIGIPDGDMLRLSRDIFKYNCSQVQVRSLELMLKINVYRYITVTVIFNSNCYVATC